MSMIIQEAYWGKKTHFEVPMNSRRKNIVSKYTKILRYCYEFRNDRFIDRERIPVKSGNKGATTVLYHFH